MYTHVYNYDPLLLVDLLPMVSCLYPAITTQAGGSGMGWGGGWFRLPGNTLIHILANYIYVGYCTQSVYTYIYIYNIMHKNRNINISYIYIHIRLKQIYGKTLTHPYEFIGSPDGTAQPLATLQPGLSDARPQCHGNHNLIEQRVNG